MKSTLKILPLMLGIMLFFTQCEKEAEIDRSLNAEAFMNLKDAPVGVDCFVIQELWAGAGRNILANGTLVGKVIASITDGILTVEYEIDYPYFATEYHLWVGKEIKDIPRNAAPGQFPYSGKASYVIDLGDLGFVLGDPIYLAAHAVVDFGLEELVEALPETVKFSIVLDRINTYLTTTVTEGGILNGEYGSYCIDSGTFISENTEYDANVYSSYALPVGFTKVDKPENFPKVNWIINNITVGEHFTYADVQRAIWELLETTPVNIANPPLEYDTVKVAEIIAAAEAYQSEFGDFVPVCGQYLVIVLDPIQNVQPVIIWKPVPCGETETAWAFGKYAFNKQKPRIAQKWGWIFDMTYCE